MFEKLFNSGESDDGVRYISNMVRSSTVMLDLVILIFVLMALSYVMSAFVNMFYVPPLEIMEKSRLNLGLLDGEQAKINAYYLLALVMQIIQLVAIYMYITFMWYKFGTTPAKFLFGVRIVDADTLQKITFRQATIRFVSIIISVLPLCLGIIWSIFDKRSQAWHDKIANTVLTIKDVE